MSLPYILEEKTVVRRENSPLTITEAIAEAKSWIEELQSNMSKENVFYYADVYDMATKQKFYVYTDATASYFDLTNTVVELDNLVALKTEIDGNIDAVGDELTTTQNSLIEVSQELNSVQLALSGVIEARRRVAIYNKRWNAETKAIEKISFSIEDNTGNIGEFSERVGFEDFTFFTSNPSFIGKFMLIGKYNDGRQAHSSPRYADEAGMIDTV